jgi:hypothetical protein
MSQKTNDRVSKILSKVPNSLKNNFIYKSLQNQRKHSHEKKQEIILDSFLNDKRYDKYFFEIEKLRDIHSNDRCFICGTGPSIQKTNLDLLRNEIIFGVNTAFLLNLNFEYYAFSDENVWNKVYSNILKLDTTLFIGGKIADMYMSDNKKYLDSKATVIALRQLRNLRESNNFEIDIPKGFFTCHNVVTSLCLQTIFHLGFKEVYLLGCDCTYDSKYHFHENENYYYKDQMNHTKREGYWSEVFKEYTLLKRYYEKHDRKIYNSTVGGNLEVFERRPLENVI